MYLFQQLRKSAKGINFKSEAEARDWYRREAAAIGKADIKKVQATAEPFKLFKNLETPAVGKMFMFAYDAKHKATLPYFDKFPLVFPIQFYSDGFLGINLHYLPIGARAVLMDNLYDIANNNKYNSSMKLNISYDILKQASKKFSGFENCVKRYLFGHIKSSFHYVNPADWDKALMLPLQRWHINPNKMYAGTPPS